MIRSILTAAVILTASVTVASPPEATTATSGTTMYRVTGISEPQVIDGWLVTKSLEGDTRKEPFGYITVVKPENVTRVAISAENKDRQRLLVEKFGDGWRVMSVGPVWADIYYYRTIQLDGQDVEFIVSHEELQFTVEGEVPKPEPEPEPEPEPDSESPFTADGLQVLVIYDSDDILDTNQSEVLFGARMLDWLDANCVRLNGQPAYRMLDKDTKGPDDSEFIKALSLPRDSIPWIVVGNGKKGFTGPLPVSVDATIRLLEEFK